MSRLATPCDHASLQHPQTFGLTGFLAFLQQQWPVLDFRAWEESLSFGILLQGPEMGRRGWTSSAMTQKGSCTQEKDTFSVREKYVENARQKEKDVQDLLEAIMRPTCVIKEELRQNLFRMSQFRPEITKIRV